jgi:hypothetical protein
MQKSHDKLKGAKDPDLIISLKKELEDPQAFMMGKMSLLWLHSILTVFKLCNLNYLIHSPSSINLLSNTVLDQTVINGAWKLAYISPNYPYFSLRESTKMVTKIWCMFYHLS